jgi:hypothetical protein
VHSFRYTAGDAAMALAPAWPFTVGYLVMAVVFLLAPALTEPGEGH